MNHVLFKFKLIFTIVLVLGSMGFAQTSTPVPLPNGDFSNQMANWSREAKNKEDAKFEIDKGALRISRTKGAYFMRAFRDVTAKPNMAYKLTFRIKVQGEGYGSAWVIIHTKDGQWLEKAICFSPTMKASDWQTIQIQVPASAQMDKLRLNFAPKGSNTTLWLDDVTLTAITPQTSEFPLIPTLEIRPRLDGKISEGFWQFALKLDDFRVLGFPNQRAQQKTQVMLAIYQDALWIAYRMDESNPKGIRGLVDKPNDIAIYNDDCTETFVSFDRKRVTQLDVNVLGHYAVGGKEPLGPPLRTWYQLSNATDLLRWKAAASRDDAGWVVEMQIPLVALLGQSQMQSDKQGHPILYANFARHRPQEKKAPHSNWAGLTGETFFAPSQFKPLALQWEIPIEDKPKEQVTRGDFTHRLSVPEHLIVGEPVLAQWQTKKVTLPAKLQWDTASLTIDPIAKSVIEPGLMSQSGQGTWAIRCRLWDQGKLPRQVTAQQAKRLNNDEAFILKITSGGADISGRTHAGVMRGLATLTMLCDGAKSQGKNQISTGVILDAPTLPIRGFLLSNRKPDEVIRAAKVLFLLRYNVVMFDATGYGPYAKFPFDSHPNIGSKDTTKAQWAQAADTIRALGMTPLPMAMLWSRCGFIANKPEYKHLAVRPDLEGGVYHNKRHDKNLSAALEESYQLVFDLLDELVDTMKLKNVHLALDEIFFDEMVTDPASKKLGLTRSQWLIRVVNRTRDHLKKRGVKFWMWADCLDPDQNAKHFEIPAAQMLAQLPKDIVLHDWKYRPPGPYTSLKMFKDAGFTTISASWWSIPNIIQLIGDTYRYGADGFIGTSWGNTDAKAISPELTTNFSLGAYLSWSPQNSDQMDQFQTIPASLYQTAAYRHAISNPVATTSSPVKITQSLISGEALVDALRLPSTKMPDALSGSLAGPLGCQFQPLSQNGKPAAVMVHGNQSETITIPLNGTAQLIAILHTASRQSFTGSMQEMGKEYKTTIPVRYVLEYKDGSTAELPVLFREQISTWDDSYVASKAWPILFGTIADAYHINIPAMLWANPHPDKQLKALQMISGNRTKMDVALLAVTLLR